MTVDRSQSRMMVCAGVSRCVWQCKEAKMVSVAKVVGRRPGQRETSALQKGLGARIIPRSARNTSWVAGYLGRYAAARLVSLTTIVRSR